MQSGDNRQDTPVPVLLLGGTPQPPCAQLLGRKCRVGRVRKKGKLGARVRLALTLSPTVVVVGGFGGAPWPGMTDVCGALAASAGLEEADVRFRWIKDGDAPLGAELCTHDARVYVISGVPEQGRRVLRYLGGGAMAAAGNPQAEPPRIQPKPPLSSTTSKQAKGNSPSDRGAKRQKIFRMATAAVLAAAAGVFVASAVYLTHYAADSSLQRKRTTELATLYYGEECAGPGFAPSHTGVWTLRKFSALYAQNTDTRGWLSIPAAGVELPVLQALDNDYYLTHDAEMALSRYGALFLDSSDRIAPGQVSRSLSIYGHNAKNGSMFGGLSKFRDQAFYDAHPTFAFDTLFEERRWVIFAVIVTGASPAKDGGFFEWRGGAQLETPERAEAFIALLRERSLIRSEVDVAPGDRLLSLATCCGDFKNARLVVYAREER